MFLSLGSNRGDRSRYLADAYVRIGRLIGRVTAISAVYETDPWGFDDSTPFLNQALRLSTPLTAGEVLSAILSIENSLGRTRQPGRERAYQSRTIDIDILFFNDETVVSGDLIIPHPRIPERKFVLAPLAEIAPDLIHPVSGKTMRELLSSCSDTSSVKKYF